MQQNEYYDETAKVENLFNNIEIKIGSQERVESRIHIFHSNG